MDKVLDYLRRINEEAQKHVEWTRRGALIASFLVGLGVCGLQLLHPLAQTPASVETSIGTVGRAALARASAGLLGLLSVAVSYALLSLAHLYVLKLRVDTGRLLDQLKLFDRLGDAVGGLLFFVASSNFDKTLSWFGRPYPPTTKTLIAKVICEQLNRSFSEEFIRLRVSTYAECSNILSHLMAGAEDVCFTCIKSPKSWFTELDQDRYVHDALPAHITRSADGSLFDRDALIEAGLSEGRVDKYPLHYVKFLEKPSRATRRRAFLLNTTEWEELVKPENREFFHKFMRPCKDIVDTRFVQIETFQKVASDARDEIRIPAERAIRSNVLRQDYEVFDRNALLVYYSAAQPDAPAPAPPAEARGDQYLEFQVGPRAEEYTAFLDLVYSDETGPEYGIYTEDQLVADLLPEAAQEQPESEAAGEIPGETPDVSAPDEGGD